MLRALHPRAPDAVREAWLHPVRETVEAVWAGLGGLGCHESRSPHTPSPLSLAVAMAMAKGGGGAEADRAAQAQSLDPSSSPSARCAGLVGANSKAEESGPPPPPPPERRQAGRGSRRRE